MNGLAGIHYAESVAEERAGEVERRAAETVLLTGVAADHWLRTRVGNGLIRVGTWLAPRPAEPPRKMHTSPSC